jgi:D-alanyl-D-alanine carboxypeptidase (penicillin-binding protein 5/6)
VKAKLFWASISILTLGVVVWVFWPQKKLLSPQSSFTPDFTAKLSERISDSPKLDLASVKKAVGLIGIRYLVYNLDSGKVYFASGATDQIAPASFTKILTAQVALDLGFPDQLLSATKTSVDKIPTILGLKVGEQFKLSELLRATIATSANDAAATIAEGIASQNGLNLADFIALMNQKAALLKMDSSHFANPDGLDDDNQFSTLIDIAKLVQNTVKNYPEILLAAASDREDIEESKIHGFYYLSNWNGLLGVYPGVFGLKIAFTENAGNSIIVLSERSKVRLAVIVTGAKSLYDRDASAASLLDQAFGLEKVPAANVTQWQLKQHYKVWNDLINKTKSEILNHKP